MDTYRIDSIDRRTLKYSKNVRASKNARRKYYERKSRGVCAKCGEREVLNRVICHECVDKINYTRNAVMGWGSFNTTQVR